MRVRRKRRTRTELSNGEGRLKHTGVQLRLRYPPAAVHLGMGSRIR